MIELDRNGHRVGAALHECGVELGVVEVQASGNKFLCGIFPHEDGRNVGFRIPLGPAGEPTAVNAAATLRALADQLDPRHPYND